MKNLLTHKNCELVNSRKPTFTPKNCDPFGLQVNRTRRTPLSSVVPEPTFICNKPRALCFQRGQIPAGHYLYRVVGYSQLRDSHRSSHRGHRRGMHAHYNVATGPAKRELQQLPLCWKGRCWSIIHLRTFWRQQKLFFDWTPCCLYIFECSVVKHRYFTPALSNLKVAQRFSGPSAGSSPVPTSCFHKPSPNRSLPRKC